MATGWPFQCTDASWRIGRLLAAMPLARSPMSTKGGASSLGMVFQVRTSNTHGLCFARSVSISDTLPFAIVLKTSAACARLGMSNSEVKRALPFTLASASEQFGGNERRRNSPAVHPNEGAGRTLG